MRVPDHGFIVQRSIKDAGNCKVLLTMIKMLGVNFITGYRTISNEQWPAGACFFPP
jgi:hypothetical protein